MNQEKLSAIILSILGIVIVVDTLLQQFDIGTKQTSLVLGYCIAFVLLSIKFPDILKRKLVIIPMYMMAAQTIYSLIITYIY